MTYRFRVIDFETTEQNGPPDDEIIEIGNTDVLFDPQTLEVEILPPISLLYRPTKPLKPSNMAIHHLTMADLENQPICTDADLVYLIEPADFVVAHNWAFEALWLAPHMGETHAICTMKVARRVYLGLESYGNQALRYELGHDLDPALAMPPHRAAPDSYVTAHHLAKMLRTERVAHMVGWTLAPTYYERCPIGKHRGQLWADIPHSYLTWILREPGMESDLKAAATDEIERRKSLHT